jgi:hypothetical protein
VFAKQPFRPKNRNKKKGQRNKALQTDSKLTCSGQPEVLVQPWIEQKKRDLTEKLTESKGLNWNKSKLKKYKKT